jgi:hypothetical protein
VSLLERRREHVRVILRLAIVLLVFPVIAITLNGLVYASAMLVTRLIPQAFDRISPAAFLALEMLWGMTVVGGALFVCRWMWTRVER